MDNSAYKRQGLKTSEKINVKKATGESILKEKVVILEKILTFPHEKDSYYSCRTYDVQQFINCPERCFKTHRPQARLF